MIMIKSIIAFTILGINSFLFSIKRDDAPRQMVELHTKSVIEIVENRNKTMVNISNGDKLVFCIDDVSVGKVYFQIPEDRRFFRYTDGAMRNVDLIITSDNQIFTPETGEINGFKISDGIWKVDLSMKYKEKLYNFSQRFYQNNNTSARK